MPKVLSISKSNFAWNSLRKEHHIAHVAEKKYTKQAVADGKIALVGYYAITMKSNDCFKVLREF